MPLTSLKSLSSPMCSECCRRRSFLRCAVVLRLAQRLASQREGRYTWVENIGRESLGREPEDIRQVCSGRSESAKLDVAIDAGASWRLTSPWETAWWVTGQRAPKGWKPWWKRARCLPGSPVRASVLPKMQIIDATTRKIVVLGYPTPPLFAAFAEVW